MSTVASGSSIVAAYERHTPRARLARAAGQVFPSGITHDGRQLTPYPLFVKRASGSRKWDVDGHELVDYAGGHGALLLGHNAPEVTAAVGAQLALGTHYGACHELEIRWGQLVQQLVPCAERVRFTSSGTEATLLALRLARAFTGRSKIVRYLGHFHGWHDHMAFGVGSHFDGTPSPGVLDEVAANILLAPPGNIAATAELLHRDDVAAVIIEPTGASWGQVPVLPDFLHALRELADRHNVVLIFDEVITGFRCSPGGAQAALGITPDLTTLAKILAGGLPGGAVVGRKAIMDGLDFAACAASGREKIPHQGTFNANPLSAAAGIATLEIVAKTDACERANRFAEQLREGLNRVLCDEHVNWIVYGTYSGFHIFTNPDRLAISATDIAAGKYDYRLFKSASRTLANKLRLGMILHGVDIFSWPGGPTSAVHSANDLAITIDAFRQTLRDLRAEGELPA